MWRRHTLDSSGPFTPLCEWSAHTQWLLLGVDKQGHKPSLPTPSPSCYFSLSSKDIPTQWKDGFRGPTHSRTSVSFFFLRNAGLKRGHKNLRSWCVSKLSRRPGTGTLTAFSALLFLTAIWLCPLHKPTNWYCKDRHKKSPGTYCLKNKTEKNNEVCTLWPNHIQILQKWSALLLFEIPWAGWLNGSDKGGKQDLQHRDQVGHAKVLHWNPLFLYSGMLIIKHKKHKSIPHHYVF